MAQPSDDDHDALLGELEQGASRGLGDVRRFEGEQRNAEIEAWLIAGDNLAEKAIAALDTGDDERAERLVRRIVALPVVDGSIRSGLMAVSVLLTNEVIDPSFDDGEGRGLLDLPLRLLPTLDPFGADALRHALAVMGDYQLPAAVLRRITAVVDPENRFEAPFAGVAEEDLPAAVTAALRVALLLRSDEG